MYLRARYYVPELGRFVNEDPALDGDNWYVYANNDPVNWIDPTGLWGKKVHYDDTKKWAKEVGISTLYAEILARANYSVDSGNTSPKTTNQWALSWHFNRNPKGSKDSRIVHFERKYKEAKKSWKSDKKKAMTALGQGLHPLQDLFAHQDWAVGKDFVLPHKAWYIDKLGKAWGVWGLFDNPDYDLQKNKHGEYIAKYKGKNNSLRYKNVMKTTKAWLKYFKKEVGYK